MKEHMDCLGSVYEKLMKDLGKVHELTHELFGFSL